MARPSSRLSRNARGSHSSNVKLSKSLSWLLRHGAESEGFEFCEGGFLYVEDILKHKHFKKYKIQDVEEVVANNEKQRFSIRLCPVTNKLQIRANQGHSLQIENLELTPIVDAAAVPIVVHGTYRNKLKVIEKEGLSRMNRNHIHFAASEPNEHGVITGVRQSCDVFIYIDLALALQDGITFYQSVNNVILSPGNENGYILPKYFKEISTTPKS